MVGLSLHARDCSFAESEADARGAAAHGDVATMATITRRRGPAKLALMPTRAESLSGYAVHFTRGRDPAVAAKALAEPLPDSPSYAQLLDWLDNIDATGFRPSLNILCEGHVRPTRYALGAAKHVAEVQLAHCSACFSETSLDNLARLIETRSMYGIGFRQDVLAAAGGGRVRYLPSRSREATCWKAKIREKQRLGVDPQDPFWQQTPFIELSRANRWEEEWRVPGGFDFHPDQMAFLSSPWSCTTTHVRSSRGIARTELDPSTSAAT